MVTNKNKSFEQMELSQERVKKMLVVHKLIDSLMKNCEDVEYNDLAISINNLIRNKHHLCNIFKTLSEQLKADNIYPDMIQDTKKTFDLCICDSYYKNSFIKDNHILTEIMKANTNYRHETETTKKDRNDFKELISNMREITNLLGMHLTFIANPNSFTEQGEAISIMKEMLEMKEEYTSSKFS